MKTVVIGDIHGGFKGLVQLIEKAAHPSDTKYVFVGDYVDGWSQSYEVISFLMDFGNSHDCVFIRGNHDDLFYKYLKFGEKNSVWLSQGGESTIKSYKAISKAEKKKHLEFLESLQNYYIDSFNRLYLHAGFTNQSGPEYEYYPNLIFWDRTLWEMVCGLDSSIVENDDRYPKRLKHFKEIYIGHTPVTRIGMDEPTNFANVWNVDTGAAFKGKLSMLDVDSKEIWQSDPIYTLYPNENGRN